MYISDRYTSGDIAIHNILLILQLISQEKTSCGRMTAVNVYWCKVSCCLPEALVANAKVVFWWRSWLSPAKSYRPSCYLNQGSNPALLSIIWTLWSCFECPSICWSVFAFHVFQHAGQKINCKFDNVLLHLHFCFVFATLRITLNNNFRTVLGHTQAFAL